MTASLKDVEQQAQKLSAEDRARLAEVMLESLQEPPTAEIQAAWDREIAERVAAYERGEANAAEEVFAEARRLGR